eukprot:12597745-Heterocapsa_arctica.AAC.1
MGRRGVEHQAWEDLRLVQARKTCAHRRHQKCARGMGATGKPGGGRSHQEVVGTLVWLTR